MNKYDIKIGHIDFFHNGDYEGLYIEWNSNIGFGTFNIGITKETGKFFIDDEYMSKEFVMELFDKLYDKCKGENDE